MVDRRGLSSSCLFVIRLSMPKSRTPQRLTNIDGAAPHSYLITFCVKNRRRVFSQRRAAQCACDAIVRCRTLKLYHLYAYCVMPDHVHLAIRIADRRVHVARVVAILKSAILCDIRRWVVGFQWQRGFHDYMVRECDDSTEIVRYVLRNPVRAGLAAEESQYPYAGTVDAWF